MGTFLSFYCFCLLRGNSLLIIFFFIVDIPVLFYYFNTCDAVICALKLFFICVECIKFATLKSSSMHVCSTAEHKSSLKDFIVAIGQYKI